MKYLIEKAAELVDGLKNVENMRLYFDSSDFEGYTSDVLAVDFLDGSCKVYRYSVTRQQFEFIK